MNTVTTTIRMDEEIKKQLDMIALEENRSLNNLIVTVLIRFLDEKNAKDQNKN